MGRLLNINQVAEYLQVSRRTVYRMIEENKLPQPVMIRSSPRWDLDAIRQFIESPVKKSASNRAIL